MRILVLLMTMTGMLSATPCLPVTRNQIDASDLARADARFAALPSSLIVGFAPMPGAKKIFTPPQLQRLAKANGVALDEPSELCFEIPMSPLTVERATTAMREVLPANASVAIIELPRGSVPDGRVSFALAGLEPPAALNKAAQLWRGHVTYAGTREFAIWAQVQISALYKAVVALKDLPAGAPIAPSSVRVEEHSGPIEREQLAVRLEDAEGHITRRAVRAGAFIPLSIVIDAPAVRRGDHVPVVVDCGEAHLRFEAIVTADARTGEIVELKNPLSGKTFRARLDAGPRASIVLGEARP